MVAPEGADRHLIITKGAFGNVLDSCSRVERDGQAVALDDAERARLERWFGEQGAQGLRLLALATREVEAQAAYSPADEAGMCLVGFLHFVDPPKAEVKATLHRLAARGIRVKIVTGDNRHVAAHVAHSVGLDAKALLTGEQINAMNDEALWHRAPKTTLFVEVDPQQKERIVRALQHGGHAVGYLGDGINDAPALHAADVGISVDQAADVARESADVVLLRPDLGVLCQGVEDGRRTFSNTLKYIGITTSANFGNMLSMALAAPLLPFLPLAAKQILLNNFLSDLPAITIASDRVDDDRLATAQHWDVHDLRRYMLVFGLTSTVFDLLTFGLLLKVFEAPEALFQTDLVRGLAADRAGGAAGAAHASPGLAQPAEHACCGPAPRRWLRWPWRCRTLTPLAGLFGMVRLPLTLLGSVLLIVLAYGAATEFVKSRFHAKPPRRRRVPTHARQQRSRP